ncbi:MAG: hypothetical protein COB36_10265 [Alphaproteobacteria bacterium]|nr:MAG: hypothetical protein COB36_10265 [Alphaproteobacteria bacterium]
MNKVNYLMPINLGNLIKRPGLGERIALIDLRQPDRPQSFSAKKFNDNIRAFARGLLNLGIKQGQRVGFLSENRWEMLIGYFATMYMGAVAVPINHKFPKGIIKHIVEDSELSLIFFDDERRPLIPDNVKILGFDDGLFENFLDEGPLNEFVPDPNDIAEILYTSGSTGMPKGVLLTHKGQLWAIDKYCEPLEREGFSGGSLIVAPLYHMNALFYSSICIYNARPIILQPRFSPESYMHAVMSYQCTQLSGVPTMFAMLANLNEELLSADKSFVTNIGIGSAPLSCALLDQVKNMFPSAKISNGYGSTEAGPAIFGPHPKGLPRPELSIGYPFEGVEWRLTGGTNHNEGELELKTGAMSPGYLNRRDADQERFQDGWFRTNDIMRCDEDGFMYFISRADDMFVCGGENIFPGEVEAVLNRHPDVQDSVVVGAPDDIKGMVPVAFVVKIPDARPNEENIKSFCLENGPVYAHPRRVLFKEKLPIGGTHKIDRRSLEIEALQLMISAGRFKES